MTRGAVSTPDGLQRGLGFGVKSVALLA